MKNLTTIALAAGLAGLTVSAAYADPPAQAKPRQICIHTSDINSMSYPDNRTILFRMNGGKVKVWRNELPRECPGLKFEAGIAWTIWGGEVCSNMQVFYVLRRGTPCMLGTFVPADQPRQDGFVPPPPKK
jgi:hypothetical protein